jgi:hypothetical protein
MNAEQLRNEIDNNPLAGRSIEKMCDEGAMVMQLHRQKSFTFKPSSHLVTQVIECYEARGFTVTREADNRITVSCEDETDLGL